MSRVVEIAEKLVYPNDASASMEPLLQPHRRFILSGRLAEAHDSSSMHNRMCFLFNDIFLVTRQIESSLFSPPVTMRKRTGMWEKEV
jgi:hypothetical protein